jgi:hypothetical protein
VDPRTYRVDLVNNLLQHSAFLSMYLLPTPGQPAQPILLPGSADPKQFTAIRMCEELHRFSVIGLAPTNGQGLLSSNRTDKLHGTLTQQWTLTPDDVSLLPFEGATPPIALDPTRSQRFVMLDQMFTFDDEGKNRVRGFGAGRTFPTVVNGVQRYDIGVNGVIWEGWGIFEGVQGTYNLNGYIEPPDGVKMHMLLRIMDPGGRFLTESPLKPFDPVEDEPNIDSTYIILLGEVDPERGLQPEFSPDGQLLGVHVYELMRVVHSNYDLGRAHDGLRTHLTVGPVVGKSYRMLRFNPFDPTATGTRESPIPWHTEGAEYIFLNRKGQTIGTITGDVVEGRAFRMDLPGAPLPLFLTVGFGSLASGTGQFSGIRGMLSVNSGLSVMPTTLYNIYVLRLADPDHKFRAPGRHA